MKKMKNIFKTIALFLFAGATLVSCDLDLLPLDAVVVENYWKNKDDVESALRSCYVGLMDDCIAKMITWGEPPETTSISWPPKLALHLL